MISQKKILLAWIFVLCATCASASYAQGGARSAAAAPDSSFTLPSAFGAWFTNGQKDSRDCGSYSFIGLGAHLRMAIVGDSRLLQLFGRGSAYVDTDVYLSYDLALGAAFLERLQVLAGYSWPAVSACDESERQSIGNRGGFLLGVAYGITGLYAEIHHVWYTVPTPFTAENPDTERSASAFAFRLGYAIAL